MGDKRRIESGVHTMHAEIDDIILQAKTADEKTKRAMVDSGRLADELASEQSHSMKLQKTKRSLDSRISDVDKSHARRSLMVTKLQDQIKTLKDQASGAEEIAALNLSKFRKAQQDLEEAERRAKVARTSTSFA